MTMKGKRFFSIFLCIALVLGLMPGMSLTVNADDYGAKVSLTALSGSVGNGGNQSYHALVDSNTATKWAGAFHYNGDNTDYYIILKASKKFALGGYGLITGDDTASYSGRNWRDWTIYGANFSSDSDAAENSTEWAEIVSVVNDTVLQAQNKTKFNFPIDTITTPYQYYKIVITAIKAQTFMQMAEIEMYEQLLAASVTNGGTTQKYQTFSDAVAAWNSAGSGAEMKLLSDVTTSNTISVSGNKTLDLNGCNITMTGNSSVITVNSGTTLSLKNTGSGGGVISGGRGQTESGDANVRGGGIYIRGGSVTMYDGVSISGNNGGSYGGGVHIRSNGSFTMEGGTITGNTVSGGWNGGSGVHVDNGTFTMKGGTITGNYDNASGDSVCVMANPNATLDLQGGTISGNTNRQSNKTTYAVKSSSVTKLSGNITISGASTGSAKVVDLYLDGNVMATIIGALTGSSTIKVKMGNAPRVFTDSENTAYNTAKKFSSADTGYSVLKNRTSGQLYLGNPPVASVTNDGTTTDYDTFTAALTAWTDGSTLTLLADVETGNRIDLSAGNLTLDLNGYGLKKTGSAEAVFYIGSGCNLTMKDSNEADSTHYYSAAANRAPGTVSDINDTNHPYSFTGGYITGGKGRISNGSNDWRKGGALYVDGGTFTMDGGTFVGNTVDGSGMNGVEGGTIYVNRGTFVLNGGSILAGYSSNGTGGVFVDGAAAFQMNGGEIKHCLGTYGGAVRGSCTMSGGKITENMANSIGGVTGSLTMSGGEITDNKGGGTGSAVTISGNSVITGNTVSIDDDTPKNVYLSENVKISVNGRLAEGADIGVTMQTIGVFTNSVNKAYNDADKFTSDNSDYIVGKNTDGQLVIGTPVSKTVIFQVVNGAWDDGSTTDQAVTLKVLEGDTLKLSAEDIPAVGNRPDDSYKAGNWDKTPDSDVEITADATYIYTYTYAAIEAAVVTKVPSIKSLTYNGSAQELVGAGEAVGGTLQYALGDVNGAADSYSESIPAGTNAGTYYVWYKIAGDKEHKDTEAVCITVTIIKRTIQVEGIQVKDKTYDGTAEAVLDFSGVNLEECGMLKGDALSVKAEGAFEDGKAGTKKKVIISNLVLSGPNAENYNLAEGEQQTEAEADITKRAAFVRAKDQTVGLNGSIEESVSRAVLEGAVPGHELSALTLTADSTAKVTIAGTITPAGAVIMDGNADVTENYSILYTAGVLTVEKGVAEMSSAPQVRSLVYNGSEQELVTAGTAEGGTILYELMAADSTNASFADDIPAAGDAGTYMVSYYLKGDENHGDIGSPERPVETLTIIIKKAEAAPGTLPAPKTGLLEEESAQELVTAGESKDGTYYYRLGKSGRWETGLPKAGKAGCYTVFYFLEGDKNHEDSGSKEEPLGSISVLILSKEIGGMTGRVLEADGKTPVGNAEVTLKRGNRKVESVRSAEDGGYQFTVAAGKYNLVVVWEPDDGRGSVTKTMMINLEGRMEEDIILPAGQVSSILEVGEGSAEILVDGLDVEAEAIQKETGAGIIEVVMKVDGKAEPDVAEDAGAVAIGKTASEKKLDFFEILVEKTVDSHTTRPENTKNVMEIIIPYLHTGRREVCVYRYHGSEVQVLKEDSTGEDGTFSVDRKAGVICIYASRFSMYAIGYTPYHKVSSILTLEDYTGQAAVTLEKMDSGEKVKSMTVSLENGEGECAMDDVPKGMYLLTAVWEDGKANQITMPFEIN